MNQTNAILHLQQDPKLRELIQNIEVPDFTPSRKIYFNLLESIVSQQLSVKASDTIFNRFLDLFPDRYPHPEHLLVLEIDQLRAVGLSNQKARYMQNVAAFSKEYDLETHDWDAMSDEEIITFLTQIKGVGKWTVEMLLMFTLGRTDILPVDDLGIQQGIQRLYGLEETGKDLKKRMFEIAEPWRPYRTYACRYLWRFKDSK
ncbi:MAG: DNA-3-methyladenine glycosylase 2 family protein [Bacteroidota bacterium]